MKGLEFTLLDICHIWSDKFWNVATSNVATKSNRNPTNQYAWAPIMSVLVKHPDVGYFLFDTGFSPINVKTRTPYQLEYFALETETIHYVDERLSELGLTKNDINAIVLSHLHWDHADGCEIFSGTEAIKNVYVQTAELRDALLYTHGAGPKDPGDPIYTKRLLDNPDISYRFVDHDTEIFPGVFLYTVSGHTQGGLVMRLELESGSYIFTGDAICTAANFGPPPALPGIIKDSLGFIECVEKVRAIEQKYNAKMIYSHDPDVFMQFKHAPYFYQ